MNEEIKRILKLVEDGKLTSGQASELISAIKDKDTNSDEQPKGIFNRQLKVIVKSHNGKNINIKLPLKFVKGIIKATGKLPVHINGDKEIDMEAISQAIENDICGKICEVNADNGDNVEVVIE